MKHFTAFLSIAICLCANAFSQNVVINEIMSNNGCTIEDEDGDTPDWIELYNTTNSIININGYQLSDDAGQTDKWIFPQTLLQPYGFLLVFASGKDRISGPAMHTNFKLSSSGEPLFLSNPQGNLLDEWEPIELAADRSFGRIPDGSVEKSVFYKASPSTSNNEQNDLSELTLSHESGLYSAPFNLSVTCTDTVRYTLDGSAPTATSTILNNAIYVESNLESQLSQIPTSVFIYNQPIGENLEAGWQPPVQTQQKGVVIRARAFKNSAPSSPTTTATYFFRNAPFSLPVAAITVDPQSFFNPDTGLYVHGARLDSTNLGWTGNYFISGKQSERPAHLNYFSRSGEELFSSNLGVRISGNATRKTPQKSLRLIARCEYGNNRLDYPFFGSTDIASFKRLTLRSSYSYWWGTNTLFTDELLQGVIAEASPSLDVQASEPTIVYFNGEYWGIQNLRERQDRQYLGAYHNVNSDSIDLFEGNLGLIDHGSSTHYAALVDYTLTHNLSDDVNYQVVENEVDIDNYIEYLVYELYFGNLDWPKNNVKIWRSNTPKTKYRFLILDFDATLHNSGEDPFAPLFQEPFLPLLFTQLMDNETFKIKLADRFIHHLKTTFSPDHLIAKLDSMVAIYELEVPQHIERWGNPTNEEIWFEGLDKHREFFRKRPCAMEYFLSKYFNDISFEFNCNQENSQLNFEISVFPNPTNGRFILNVASNFATSAEVQITTLTGGVALKTTAQTGWNSIDVSTLTSGIYFVRVRTDNTLNTAKLIVTN